MESIKRKIIKQLNEERLPHCSVKELKFFKYYFFIVAICAFVYFFMYEPAFKTHSFFTLDSLIGIISYASCYLMIEYLGFQIKRKINGYQLTMIK